MKTNTSSGWRDSGSIFVVIAASLWAIDGVLRRSLYVLPPLAIVWWEHVVGLALLVGFGVWQWLRRSEPQELDTTATERGSENQGSCERAPLLDRHLDRRSLVLGAAIGLFSGLIGTLAFTGALQMVNFIPFSVVLLVQKLQPIFAGLTAWLLLGERAGRRYLIWAGVALAAAYFVTFPSGAVNLSSRSGQLAAAGLALLAAASWGSSTTLSKLLLKRTTVIRASMLRFSWTIVWGFLIIVGMAVYKLIAQPPPTIEENLTVISPALMDFLQTIHLLALPSPSQLFTLLIIALSTGLVAVLFYYRGLQRTPVLITTILELVFPLLAVFIDIFLYKTTLQPSQYVAAVVMLFAVFSISQLVPTTKTVISTTAP